MKTKAFTDIKQSEKLAKILRVESADLWYAECYDGHVESNGEYVVAKEPYYTSLTKPSESNYSQDAIKDIPCWSLAALLNILPHEIKNWNIIYNIEIHSKNNNWFISYKNNNEELVGTYSVFLIDASVEMIQKLHELNLL